MGDALARPHAGPPMEKPRLGLTPVQSRCLAAIRKAVARDGIAPSFDELKDALGFKSKSRIHHLVTQLAMRGAITRRIGTARSIALTPQYRPPPLPCPHCGQRPEHHPQEEEES